MAKLRARQVNRLRKSQFGLPSQRKYPMPDRRHAANAKARAKQQLNRGNLSRSQYNKIVAKANRVLKRTAKRKSSSRKRTRSRGRRR